jgi:hypothetical protein
VGNVATATEKSSTQRALRPGTEDTKKSEARDKSEIEAGKTVRWEGTGK